VVETPEFTLTAAVWGRGILADHYRVPADPVTYLTGGHEQPGRIEKAPLDRYDSSALRFRPPWLNQLP
jgi:4,5-dihydroxyphthalate decarboxylase